MAIKVVFALILVTLLSLGATPVTASDHVESGTGEDQLSPFWGSAISQWNRLIFYWANARELDPDLVAAVIRKESVGRASAAGPYGSVGLMMVMPAEASGMPWRPSSEELKQPNVNLRWGTGILKQVIRDSDGNLSNALAAYNGGWEQIHIPSTKRYASSVLTFYAYAIAGRHGYSYQESKIWSLVLMTRVDNRIKLIQTHTSGHFLAPCFEGAIEFRDLYPEMVSAPRTRVARFTDDEGRDVLIDAWLFVGSSAGFSGEMLVSTAPSTPPRIGHRP